MSATLGAGGDLERLTGRKKINRLEIPTGWDTQGVGRRFFMFPSLSLSQSETNELKLSLLRKSERSVMLAPSHVGIEAFGEAINEETDLKIFSAQEIEISKSKFVETKGAVALMANRYDGIDFPGSECRLLLIDGLPKTVNSQEQFLMSRIGANVLFNERIQTRVIQAIGRCTRSLEDYSAVVVDGTEIVDFLTDIHRRKYLRPELQSELAFGIEQSIEVKASDFIENYEIFIENGDAWESVNSEIVSQRARMTTEVFPAIDDLSSSVSHEIDYVRSIWNLDYPAALSHAEAVLGKLTAPELRGYRAWWEYLCGCAAYNANGISGVDYTDKAREHFERAKKSVLGVPWLNTLKHEADELGDSTTEDSRSALVMKQVEGVELFLTSVGSIHDRELIRREKVIREGLSRSEDFEQAHKSLGEFLGFSADKVESEGSPDPFWLLENLCIVFEDHADASKSTTLSTTKARQVATHPNWMRANVQACESGKTKIIPVLLSPVTKASEGAKPHLEEVRYWNLSEFKEFSEVVFETIRTMRSTFSSPGDLAWRAKAAADLCDAGVDVISILDMLDASMCLDKIATE